MATCKQLLYKYSRFKSLSFNRLFCTDSLFKQSLFTIPNDKPYRQLLIADSKYFWIRFQNETNTDFSTITVDDERWNSLDLKSGYNPNVINAFNRDKYKHRSWFIQRTNEINGGYFYIVSKHNNHINHARNLLNKFYQNIQYFELPNTHCIHAIIGESGSNRLQIQQICNVSLFVDIKRPTQLWIISRDFNHSKQEKEKKNIKHALTVMKQLIKPFQYKIASKFCYLVIKNSRYFNQKHDVLLIYNKPKTVQFSLSLTLNIYGFQQNIQTCIADIEQFIHNNIFELKVEPNYFPLIIGKEACHLVQFEYLLNVNLHSRKYECCIMFSDKIKWHQKEENNNKFDALQTYINDIIKYKIHTIKDVNEMRFYRLINSKKWKNFKNITFDYNSKTKTLSYWIDICLYHNIDTIHDDGLMNIEMDIMSEKEKEIATIVDKLIQYFCFDEFVSYVDIRDGFMPLIAKYIDELRENCKNDFIGNVVKQNRVPIVMPKNKSNVYVNTEEIKGKEEYVLDTVFKKDKSGKYDGDNIESHRVYVFSNNAELLRSLKIDLFNLCKNAEIFYVWRMFEDLEMSKRFYIEPGMVQSKTSAKIYSNGRELFIIGNEKQRDIGRKWIKDMLQKWKNDYIGSKEEEKLTLSGVFDKQSFAEMTQQDQSQTLLDINDANLLKHF